MGIHGIYKEIGPGRRVAVSKYAADFYVQHARPLRLAIDVSIWLFQIQSGKGGTHPALRTFYYRLLRLLSLNIHPLFVFDGPNKPPFKRNKRVGGPHVKVVSVDEFLAKQLLKQFGFPIHRAPGEAEAECALLQREGVVDAVLSEDVDTLMFGSGITIRSWTAEAKGSKVPTHANVYNAQLVKEGSGLDREGMILIALMSGGDYIPEGIPGCGPKTACEAAKAGFGAQLCQIRRGDRDAFDEWRQRLKHELWTNESKLLKQKRRLNIPDDFPNLEVLRYYTDPCVSSRDKVSRLRQSLRWDAPIDFPALREFAKDAFDWTCIGGARKFVRNLAPAILTRELRLRAEKDANDGEDIAVQQAAESRLVVAIHHSRVHASTDNTPEIRISFLPKDIVNIDLSQEPPDEDETEAPNDESDSEAPMNDDNADLGSNCPGSPRKRGPSKYNPEDLEKIWLLEPFLRAGVPLMVQDWEASTKSAKAYLAQKRAVNQSTKTKRATGDVSGPPPSSSKKEEDGAMDLSGISSSAPAIIESSTRSVKPSFKRPAWHESDRDFLDEVDLTHTGQPDVAVQNPLKRSSPVETPRKHIRSRSETPQTVRLRQQTIVNLISPETTPTKAQRNEDFSVAPVPRLDFTLPPSTPSPGDMLELPTTVTKRRRRSPFRRVETAPAAIESFDHGDIVNSALTSDNDDGMVEEVDPCQVDHTATCVMVAFERRDSSVVEATDTDTFLNDTPSEPNLSQSSVQLDNGKLTHPQTLPSSNIMAAFAASKDSVPAPRSKVKKKHYQLRESLEGAWRTVDVDVEDLTSPAGQGIMAAFATTSNSRQAEAKVTRGVKPGTKGRYRHSEVEILDLTMDD